MNISDIRKQVTLLQQQRQQLEIKLINFRTAMEKGSLVRVYKTSPKQNDNQDNTGKKHGPYLYLNLKIEGRPTQRYVGKKSDKPRVKRVNTYIKYQQTLAQVRKITKQMDSLFNLYREILTQNQGSKSPKDKINHKS